ncbi:MAG: hypothetical protein M1368_10455 [Thaumarchaeota archaeon]|nr:hypothetical protein [Nitrososphaerota archaeon]
MITEPGTLTKEEKSLIKEYSKRKVFLFAYVISAVAFIAVFGLESENPTFLIDDYAKTILPIIAIIFFAATWKKESVQALKRTNNVGTVVGALILVFAVLAILLEIGRTEFVADDFPAVILGLLAVVNGLV